MMTIFFAFLLSTFAQADDLKTVPFVDINRYMGNWYEIAANPMPFEKDCVCSRQQLSLVDGGLVRVRNTCNDRTQRGPVREVVGSATNDDPTTNARFTVDFGMPDKGQYWVIALAPDYRYAVVSEPSRKALFILSKTPTLSEDLYASALREANSQVDVFQLVRTEQTDCTYP